MSDPRRKEKPAEERIANSLERIGASLERFTRMQVLDMWYAAFQRLETILSEPAIETMRTMLPDFLPKEYIAKIMRDEEADGFEKKIRRILVRQRAYEYLMFSFKIMESYPGEFKNEENAARKWLRDLCHDLDFRMVHLRQGMYYPEFAQEIKDVLLSESERCRELGQQELAEEMDRMARVSDAEKGWNWFKELPGDDGVRIAIERKAGRSLLKMEDFIYFWVLTPGIDDILKAGIEKVEIN